MKDANSIHKRIDYLREQICNLLIDDFGFDSTKAKEIAMGNNFISTSIKGSYPQIIGELNNMYGEINTLAKELTCYSLLAGIH